MHIKAASLYTSNIIIIIMIKQDFVDRENELKILKEAYNSGRAEFIILYGRRRIGKTELIKKSKEAEKIYLLLCRRSAGRREFGFV